MTDIVQNESNQVQAKPASPNESDKASGSNVVLLAVAILGMIALIAYQFFFCAGCYA